MFRQKLKTHLPQHFLVRHAMMGHNVCYIFVYTVVDVGIGKLVVIDEMKSLAVLWSLLIVWRLKL